jgi:hypothetical protein
VVPMHGGLSCSQIFGNWLRHRGRKPIAKTSDIERFAQVESVSRYRLLGWSWRMDRHCSVASGFGDETTRRFFGEQGRIPLQRLHMTHNNSKIPDTGKQ